MHQHYRDILNRIREEPEWFDEGGVPRFDVFSPRDLNNIYAGEAALAEVSCQGCGHEFRVALTDRFTEKRFSLSDEILLGRVHYGDPPNIRCCHTGPTMNSIMHGILEYWSRDHEVSFDWLRDPTFEGRIEETFDPPDAVPEIVRVASADATAILVMCTSRRNRYDLAARTAAAMVATGRVLIAVPREYSVVARSMFEGLLPGSDIGWFDGNKIVLADFSRLKEVRLSMVERILILSGPKRRAIDRSKLNPQGIVRSEAAEKLWSDAVGWLSTASKDKTTIEFALAHSHQMIAAPDFLIDAGGVDDAEA